jgi:hypothetical protein
MMGKFDFKKYHVRAMNASSESEKLEINKELKDYYNALGESDKVVFNEELQSFLIKEMAKIKSVYDGATGQTEN